MFIVFINQSQIEIANISCHSFKPYHLNIIHCIDKEWRLCDIYQAGTGWLQKHIWTECGTIKPKMPVWDLEFESFVVKFLTRSSPSQEISINSSFNLPLFFFIIWIFTTTTSNYIFCYYSTLWVKLDIFCFLFAHHDWFLESKMNGSNNFFFTGLEESVLDVWKSDVDRLILDVVISESIEMTFKISFWFLLAHSWTHIEVSENRSFSLIKTNSFLLYNIFFSIFLTHL